jgi:hypothetical protein
MKFDWQWPAATVFSAVFLVLGGLVYSGRLHPEVLMGVLMWLAPGPWQAKPSGSSVTTTTSTEIVAAAPPSKP